MLALLIAAFAIGTGAPTTHEFRLPDGGFMRVTRTPGLRSKTAKVWSSPGPKYTVFTAARELPLEENRNFGLSPTGMSLTDSGDANGSGMTTWSPIALQYTEGDKVEITMSCNKMSLSFDAFNCTDSKFSFHRSVSDVLPESPRTLTFSFIFQPPNPNKDASIIMMAKPTKSKTYSAWYANAGWIFKPGAAAPEVKSDLSISDATKVGGDVSYLLHGISADFGKVDRFFSKAPELKGVSADGVSMLVVTAKSPSETTATFSVGGAGGALYPISNSSPLKTAGSDKLEVKTIKLDSGGYGAVALYRPPNYFGRGGATKPIRFGVKVGSGPETFKNVDLIRPPVVLVHGTYDNPKFCYETHDDEDDSPTPMAPLLRSLGYRVWCVDWEETNGSKDPSDFQTNRLTVWKNKDGLKDAITTMRSEGYAVTQADVICHSQGGVITRTYARGYPFSTPLPPDHKHYTDPRGCSAGGEACWYHRGDNNFTGDIHRLITISTTHRGSHCCNLFPALADFSDKATGQLFARLVTQMFLVVVDKKISGITTGGFLNQIPDSLELQLIGPTPVPSHAIACMCTDEDMLKTRINHRYGVTQDMGDYFGKLFLVQGIPDAAKYYAFDKLAEIAEKRNVPNAREMTAEYKRLNTEYQALYGANTPEARKRLPEMLRAVIYQIRKIVFQGDDNDCTVSKHSSYGLLEKPYVTDCEHVLHGWATRYRNVQTKVIQLLTDDGGQFAPDGFPGYSGIKSKASTFMFGIRPKLDEAAPVPSVPSIETGPTPQPTVGAAPVISPSSWSDLASGGTVRVDEGELTLILPTRGGLPQAAMAAALTGDFDVSYDFELVDWPADGTLKELMMFFRLRRDADGDGAVGFVRETIAGNDTFGVVSDVKAPVMAPATGSQGKMRVKRVGKTWTFYKGSGSQWTQVDQIDIGSAPMYLGFSLAGIAKEKPLTAKVRSGKSAAKNQGTSGESETAIPPGTLILDDVVVDMKKANMPETWKATKEGDAVWKAPWFTTTYKIRAPKQIKLDGSSEISIEFELKPNPGQGGSAFVKFWDSEIERTPFDRELAQSAPPGQTIKGSKTWKLKRHAGTPDNKAFELLVDIGDGPMYVFKYRVAK